MRLSELENETILLHKRSVSVGVYDKVMRLLSDSGVAPKVVQTRTGPYEEAGTILVASGKGLYIAGGTTTVHPGSSREVRAIPISDPSATVPVCFAWRSSERSEHVLRFIRSMRDALKSESEAPSSFERRPE